MITFKETPEVQPGSFQVHVNRKPIGFWVDANSAQEAEQKFIAMAAWDPGKENLQKELAGVRSDWAAVTTNLKDVTEERDALATEVKLLEAQRRELMDTIQKMKTEAPDPEQFKSRRLFRRW